MLQQQQQMQLQQQQQQQQLQVQEQQQLSQQSMQRSVQQQQSFQQSSSMQQSSSSMSSSQQSFQQQSASSFQQAASSSFQQASSSSFEQSSSFQQSSSMQQSSSFQQSSTQQSAISSSNQQMSMMKEAEPEVIYLKHVERQAQQQKKEEIVNKYAPPQFMAPLMNVNVNEGERAHFEAKVGPVGDPSMVVEWYFNGNLIPASSRINTACQFGFVSMDMLNATGSDAGDYTCVVRSDSGHDKSFCQLTVMAKKEIESEIHSPSF